MPAPRSYLEELFSLEGMTAAVVGATGALGGAAAQCLGQAGATVLVLGRNAQHAAARIAAIEAAGGRAEFLPLDATSGEAWADLAARLRREGRRVDILVNAAGINAPTPFLDIDDDEWDRIFDVNLRSVRLGCQAIGRMMLERGTPGSIINVASLSGIVPLSRVYTYAASKAAVINLTLNLAREWASQGIRVNALSPGFFPTEQNRRVLTPDRVEKIMQHTPMHRFGEPHELHGAILLLASPRAGSFLTGHNLVVDGGFMAMTI
jgi:NAD(P)-dependent dehydrogenase (short-subunit alcohol dehydrogenase family)